jgi:hypothetical protein
MKSDVAEDNTTAAITYCTGWNNGIKKNKKKTKQNKTRTHVAECSINYICQTQTK